MGAERIFSDIARIDSCANLSSIPRPDTYAVVDFPDNYQKRLATKD